MPSESEKKPEKAESGLNNNLKTVRVRLGLSQSELAARAGIARQTVGGIEAALYAPSAAVALRLSRALGCRVEDLFWIEEEPCATLFATRAQRASLPLEPESPQQTPPQRLLLGQVGGRWIAHALDGDAAFRSEMMPADGLSVADELPVAAAARAPQGALQAEQVEVQLLDSPESLARTVLVAGCSPALSLWTRSAQRWHPGLRPAWIHANSTEALEALARGEVHIAGLHLCDPHSGADNVSFVRARMGGSSVVVVNFGVWDEGLLLRAGNPKGVRGVADLAREEVRFVNRENGAGSRLLFDALLQRENVPPGAICGYEETLCSHQAVAKAVAQGQADAAMGTAAMAQIYGLDFMPLRRVRFDLAVRADFWKEEPVSQLFETLTHRSVRLQLQKLGGYDTAQTGNVLTLL